MWYSPRMWRWSWWCECQHWRCAVFSTYVEVILIQLFSKLDLLSILHVCGGDPMILIIRLPRKMVFSTYVEVILRDCIKIWVMESILHVCGGDPIHHVFACKSWKYSPRMWRWSCYWNTKTRLYGVFSTYVEVILTLSRLVILMMSILHVCGGDPVYVPSRDKIQVYSPRMWRWSRIKRNVENVRWVFSTYVEVILQEQKETTENNSILHVCGGDPVDAQATEAPKAYSPRMWRWSPISEFFVYVIFVFSTYVEVILLI